MLNDFTVCVNSKQTSENSISSDKEAHFIPTKGQFIKKT